MKLDDVIEVFNKDRKNKAKLVSASDKLIVVEMEGTSKPEDDVYALRGHIESAIDKTILFQSIEKSGDAFTIKFSTEKGPAEDILEILKRYDEGTKPRGYITEE